jgi:aerobic-type carbon monoxide dehydrogenase small subunit (CoxS/CutS family)
VREVASSHLCRCTGYRGIVEAIATLAAGDA